MCHKVRFIPTPRLPSKCGDKNARHLIVVSKSNRDQLLVRNATSLLRCVVCHRATRWASSANQKHTHRGRRVLPSGLLPVGRRGQPQTEYGWRMVLGPAGEGPTVRTVRRQLSARCGPRNIVVANTNDLRGKVRSPPASHPANRVKEHISGQGHQGTDAAGGKAEKITAG